MKTAAAEPSAAVRIGRIAGERGFERWDELLALILDAFAFMDGRIDPPSSALRLTPERLAADAASGIAFVAETGGALVGCVFCKPKGDALYIGKLAVRPDCQKRGVGRALIAAVEAAARDRGCAALELQTRIELVENHAAFAAMGFRRTAENAHPGYHRPTNVTMRRALSST